MESNQVIGPNRVLRSKFLVGLGVTFFHTTNKISEKQLFQLRLLGKVA